MSSTTTYLGDGVHMTHDGSLVTLSVSRTGERPITLRPAVLKRLIRACLSQLHTLPDEPVEPPAPETSRKIPLLVTPKSRDEEMAEWEETLRRKATERRRAAAAAAASRPSPAPQPKGLGDLI